MSAPKRIQRKRTKGWRMPEGVVYVGRPTKWGNPFRIVPGVGSNWPFPSLPADERRRETAAEAVRLYRYWLTSGIPDWGDSVTYMAERSLRDAVVELAGLDLACWCPLDQPCHADVLLELANPDLSREPTPVSPLQASHRTGAPSGASLDTPEKQTTAGALGRRIPDGRD